MDEKIRNDMDTDGIGHPLPLASNQKNRQGYHLQRCYNEPTPPPQPLFMLSDFLKDVGQFKASPFQHQGLHIFVTDLQVKLSGQVVLIFQYPTTQKLVTDGPPVHYLTKIAQFVHAVDKSLKNIWQDI